MAFAQPHLVEPVAGGVASLGAAQDFQRQHDVFLGGEIGHQLEMLKYKATLLTTQAGPLIFAATTERLVSQQHLTAGGHIQAGEQRQ